MNKPLITIAFFFLLGPSLAHGEILEGDGNLREHCRQRVAGYYLDLYDAIRYAKDYVSALTAKEKELRLGLKKAVADVAKLDHTIAVQPYNNDLIMQRDARQGSREELERILAETVAERKTFAKTIAPQEAELKRLKTRIEYAFHFVPIKGTGLGYPFRLEYRHPCPRFHAVCPLPKEQRRSLLAIFPADRAPEVCVHYASFALGGR